LHKANEQLLLASELTLEAERAERLADLAHQVGELAEDGEPDPSVVETIDTQLEAIRADAHEDVADAVDRAQDLLTTFHAAEPV
jgi:hypothetical protein